MLTRRVLLATVFLAFLLACHTRRNPSPCDAALSGVRTILSECMNMLPDQGGEFMRRTIRLDVLQERYQIKVSIEPIDDEFLVVLWRNGNRYAAFNGGIVNIERKEQEMIITSRIEDLKLYAYDDRQRVCAVLIGL